eukprot:PhM_4_TR2515/c0_g1_i1/m.95426
MSIFFKKNDAQCFNNEILIRHFFKRLFFFAPAERKNKKQKILLLFGFHNSTFSVESNTVCGTPRRGNTFVWNEESASVNREKNPACPGTNFTLSRPFSVSWITRCH